MVSCWRRGFPSLLTAAVLTLLGAGSAQAQQSDTTAVRLATEATTAWLRLVDNGLYDQSWEAAAPAFRQKVNKAAWGEAVAEARAPFEPLGARMLLGATYRESLPNVAGGPFVIIQYRTKAAGDRDVIETVTPMRGADGKWQVSGYFVRPAS